MKFTTKSATTLLAILAASAVGTVSAFADPANQLDSEGTVKVTEADDTGNVPGGELPDPEEPGTTKPDPGEVDDNTTKGPLKVESVSKLKFGSISTSASAISKEAATVKTSAGERGALVTFADVRSNTYGYTLNAKLSQQFVTGSQYLTGSTLTYNYGIARPEEGNVNAPGTLNKTTFELSTSGDTVAGDNVTVYTADKTGKEGKGRTVLEFGQSADYDPAANPAPSGSSLGTGTPNTADKGVTLNIPTATASSMATGDYVAKVTWTLVAAAE